MRRALILAALLAGAITPAAHAQSSLVVQASAVTHFGGFEQATARFECAAADATGATTQLTRCSFGPLYATLPKGGPAVATGAGTVRAGWPYDLCVSATSYPSTGPVTVSRCAPYSFLTGSLIIGT